MVIVNHLYIVFVNGNVNHGLYFALMAILAVRLVSGQCGCFVPSGGRYVGDASMGFPVSSHIFCHTWK